MKKDIEADFWKDIFVHMQHKNMMSTSGTKLSIENAQKEFENFSLIFPQIKADIDISNSYITWEIFITTDIKLRLFIQSQITASIFIIEKGEPFKITNGKFPNNPFPQIIEMLKNVTSYENQLLKKEEELIKNSRRQQIIGEFIKARLMKKYDKSIVMWNLQTRENDFVLTLEENGEKKELILNDSNFISKI